jgi:hypothetical protein
MVLISCLMLFKVPQAVSICKSLKEQVRKLKQKTTENLVQGHPASKPQLNSAVHTLESTDAPICF